MTTLTHIARTSSPIQIEPRPAAPCRRRRRLRGPPDGAWRVAWLRRGRISEPFGPAFASARDAATASRAIRERLGLA